MATRLPFSLAAATRHLRASDPVVAALIDRHGPYTPRPTRGAEAFFAALTRTIVFQQLSGASARAIFARFLALYPDGELTPAHLLHTPDEALRGTGISHQKIAYLQDLALRVADGRLDLDALPALSDEAVTAAITGVHGLGEWSAHMFLMFQLGRPDVLPTGDLGVRHGVRAAYCLPDVPTPTAVRRIAEPWTPFRSVASWYMWRAAAEPKPEVDW